jgi:phage anti-repressor protein
MSKEKRAQTDGAVGMDVNLTINAKVLHGCLMIEQDFSAWIEDIMSRFVEKPVGVHTFKEYFFTIDMAEELLKETKARRIMRNE